MRTRIQQRSDTTERWTQINPMLAMGEIGFESDSGLFKIGNGLELWSALPYQRSETPSVDSTVATPLGSIEWLVTNNIPDGYEPLWDGHTITRAQYPTFFSQIVDGLKLPTVTNSVYNTQVSTYGSCPSFIRIDGSTIRLPTLNTYMRAGAQLGTVLNDQIVNITGDLNYVAHGSQIMTSSGAFSSTASGVYGQAVNSGSTNRVTFDASRLANVRTGNQVQPKSFMARPFLKCADLSRTLAQEETTQIRNLYANKANTDLSNATLAKQLMRNGYYKAPDGLMFQWGEAMGSGNTTVYYPTAFSSVFSVIASTMTTSGDLGVCNAMPYYIGVSYCSVRSRWTLNGDVGNFSNTFKWFAIGTWR